MYISSVAILVQAGFHQEGRMSEEAARRIQDYDDEDVSRRARDEAVAAASVGGGGLHDAHVATAEKNHTRDENQHGGSYTCAICQMGVQLSNKEGHENDKPHLRRARKLGLAIPTTTPASNSGPHILQEQRRMGGEVAESVMSCAGATCCSSDGDRVESVRGKHFRRRELKRELRNAPAASAELDEHIAVLAAKAEAAS